MMDPYYFIKQKSGKFNQFSLNSLFITLFADFPSFVTEIKDKVENFQSKWLTIKMEVKWTYIYIFY